MVERSEKGLRLCDLGVGEFDTGFEQHCGEHGPFEKGETKMR